MSGKPFSIDSGIKFPEVPNIQPASPVGKGRRGCGHGVHRRAVYAR